MIPSRHSKPRYIQTPHGVCSDSVLRKGTRSGYSSLHPHLPLDRAVFSIAEHGLSQRYALTSPPSTIANPFDSISLPLPHGPSVVGPQLPRSKARIVYYSYPHITHNNGHFPPTQNLLLYTSCHPTIPHRWKPQTTHHLPLSQKKLLPSFQFYHAAV